MTLGTKDSRALYASLREHLSFGPDVWENGYLTQPAAGPKCLDTIAALSIPESHRFSTPFPNTATYFICEDQGTFYRLSLRRALRNRNAQQVMDGAMQVSERSMHERFADELSSVFGTYSSDVLMRRLRRDPTLLRMMADSPSPISLLGKLEAEEPQIKEEKRRKISVAPVLVIPGAERSAAVQDWERKNTTYLMDRGLFLFVSPFRVAKETYERA